MSATRLRCKSRLIGTIAAATVWFGPAASFAAVAVVGNCLGASPYATIQSAVNAVSAGSSLVVYAAGIFVHDMRGVNLSNLTVEGPGIRSTDARQS
jgi:hypothetical protein